MAAASLVASVVIKYVLAGHRRSSALKGWLDDGATGDGDDGRDRVRPGGLGDVGLSFSVGFVDETLWRTVEPGTPSPRRRLDAVRTLTDAGFSVGVLMAPILPFLSDSDESIDRTVAAIADSERPA